MGRGKFSKQLRRFLPRFFSKSTSKVDPLCAATACQGPRAAKPRKSLQSAWRRLTRDFRCQTTGEALCHLDEDAQLKLALRLSLQESAHPASRRTGSPPRRHSRYFEVLDPAEEEQRQLEQAISMSLNGCADRYTHGTEADEEEGTTHIVQMEVHVSCNEDDYFSPQQMALIKNQPTITVSPPSFDMDLSGAHSFIGVLL